MNLISIMQNIELRAWSFSTEMFFVSASMSLIFLVMSFVLSNAFSIVFLRYSDESVEDKENSVYLFICSIIIFTLYNYLFLGNGYFQIPSIVLLITLLLFNLYHFNSIKLALSKIAGFTLSYLIASFIVVDYFDIYNAMVFLSVSFVPLVCFISFRKSITHFDKLKLISGFIVFLSIAAYSFNIDRVLVTPSIDAYHSSITKDLNSGLNYKDLSNIYDADIKKTDSYDTNIQISGLRNHFSAKPLDRIQSIQVIKAQGQHFKISSSNHPTVLYFQAKISALLMMIMPCSLWLLIIIYIGNKHHSNTRRKRS